MRGAFGPGQKCFKCGRPGKWIHLCIKSIVLSLLISCLQAIWHASALYLDSSVLSGAVAVSAVLLVAALDHPLTLMVPLSNATDATVRTTLLETALRLEMKPQFLPPRSATSARRPAISLGKQRCFFLLWEFFCWQCLLLGTAPRKTSLLLRSNSICAWCITFCCRHRRLSGKRTRHMLVTIEFVAIHRYALYNNKSTFIDWHHDSSLTA